MRSTHKEVKESYKNSLGYMLIKWRRFKCLPMTKKSLSQG